MAAWRDSITITTEIAFSTDPWGTPSWTDVSAYVRGWNIAHGTTDPDGTIEPSTGAVVLDNRDRRFDPDYSSSPYDPNVLPMRKIRVTAERVATSQVILTGYITRWPTEWLSKGDGTVSAPVVGVSRLVGNELLPGSAYEAEVLADDPIGYWPLQQDLTDLGPEGATLAIDYPAAATFTEQSLPLGATYAASTTDIDSIDPTPLLSGTVTPSARAIECWFRADTIAPDISAVSGPLAGRVAVLRSNGQVAIAIYITQDGRLGFYQTYAQPDDDRIATTSPADDTVFLESGEHHHLVITIDGTDLIMYANGIARKTIATSSSAVTDSTYSPVEISVVNDYRISHVAAYAAGLSSTRVQAHYLAGLHAFGHPYGETGGTRIDRVLDEIGVPASPRDIDEGGTIQGPYLPAAGEPMEYIRAVERSEQGLFFFDPEDGAPTFRSRQWFWTEADTGVVFSDDLAAGAVRYTDIVREGASTETLRNIITTSYSTVGAITRRDTTSVDAYGPSRQFVDCPTLPDGTSASNLSAYVLREKKDPTSRFTRLVCPVRLQASTTVIQAQFDGLIPRKPGDVVQVEHTPLGLGSQVVKQAMVLGIEHEIDPEQWLVTLYLAPAPTTATDAPYFTIADATLGRVGASAGNKIPF